MSDSAKLKKSLFGFGKESVLDYINTVSKNVDDKLFLKDNEIKKLKKTIEELNQQIAGLQKEISDFQDEKSKLAELYIHAEETSARIKREAEEKAEKLVSETESDIASRREQFENEIETKKSEWERECESKRAELSKEIDSQKAIISGYKAEIRSLKEKIRVTLSSFDDILTNTVG